MLSSSDRESVWMYGCSNRNNAKQCETTQAVLFCMNSQRLSGSHSTSLRRNSMVRYADEQYLECAGLS